MADNSFGARLDKEFSSSSNDQQLLFSKWFECFKVRSFSDLLKTVDGIPKVVTLMLVKLCFPRMGLWCSQQTDIRLEGFRTLNKIQDYLEAIIKFGVSNQIHGRIFVLGNTGTGKTSIIHTLRAFGDSPDDNQSVLTGDEQFKHLIETKVMDLVSDVKLFGNKSLSIEKVNDQFFLIKEEISQESKEDEESFVTVNITDFGGHTEYLLSCKLFFTQTGLYLITFQACKAENAFENYYSQVGTFVDLILGHTQNPTICLLATKTDQAPAKMNFQPMLDLADRKSVVRERV